MHDLPTALAALWIAVHALGGVTAAWAGSHVGDRLARRADVWSDARCDACGRALGWRQLPLVGRLQGCARCGARGPASAPWVEVVGGAAGATASIAAPQWALIACVAVAAVSIAVGATLTRTGAQKG